MGYATLLQRRARLSFRLRCLSLALALAVALALGAHATYTRFDLLLSHVRSQGVPASTLTVVLAGSGGGGAELDRTLHAILSAGAVAALRPRVVIYAAGNSTGGAELLAHARVSDVVPIVAAGDAYLQYIVDNYYAPLPDFVLFSPTVLTNVAYVRAALRKFDTHAHLLALAPEAGCSCDVCGVPDLAVAHVRGVCSVPAESACVEDFKSFDGGQFIISKAGLQRQPLSFYQDMLRLRHAEADHWVHAEAAKCTRRDVSSGAADDASQLQLHLLKRVWTASFGCLRVDAASVCLTPALRVNVHKISIPKNTVWLLWLSGWDTAPWLVQHAAESWRFHNPGWNIEYVTAANLEDFVHIPYVHDSHISPQARSDIIRLHLLSKHGGVWADATVLCMQPLDTWVDSMLQPAGFWMYHGTGWPPPKRITHENTVYPASWFMVSSRSSYIVRTWQQHTDAYWANRTSGTDDYFWMDRLFRNLLLSDAVFLQQWHEVPFISCEDPGESHMFVSRVLKDINKAQVALLKANPPFVLKLSHHKFPTEEALFSPKLKRSAGYVAVQISKTRPAPHASNGW